MLLSGKKFLLLLLYAPTKGNEFNKEISGRTRLMKMGFLFDKEVRQDFVKDKTFEDIKLPEFFAWKYGPFSIELLNDLEFLINHGFIKVSVGTSPPIPEELEEYRYWIDDIEESISREYEQEIFSLSSEKGIPKAKIIWDILSKNQIKLIRHFKKDLTQTSLDRILEYVYKKYDEEGVANKSLIREKYLQW